MLRLVLAILLPALALFGCASARLPLLPPEAHAEGAYWTDDWDGLGEPPLWRTVAETQQPYARRLRLLLSGPFRASNRAAIRIDVYPSGRAHGYLVRGTKHRNRPWIIDERRRFVVGQRDLSQLDSLISQSRLWRLYPEHWHFTDDSICFDGVEAILERADSDGYRFSQANLQCTAPSDYRAVVAHIIAISGERDLAGWLE